MGQVILRMLFISGRLFSYIFPYSVFKYGYPIYARVYTGWLYRYFKHFGNSVIVPPIRHFKGGKYISVGEGTTLGKNMVLTAWDKYEGESFLPEITIGNGCSIGDDAHITAINSIIIGNNVLTGKKILITDNSHGAAVRELMDIFPIRRPLYSKGPVIINDNVWIGEKASIMPGVKVGKGSIIAANSVVAKDVPDYCVAAGIPAEIISRMSEKAYKNSK